MTTETFDNRIHNALFFEGNSVINGQNYSEKWSDLILSALKDVGVFDNIDIQDTPPTDTTRLWLDTRPHPTLPSVLRIYNPPTLEWRQVTFNDLFSGGGGGGGGTSLARYESTAALRTAIQNGDLVDGERFFLYDDPMIVDRSLDDDPASWLFNPNGDANLGVRSMAQLPGNYYAFMGFKTQGNNRLYINTSPDGRRFFRVNKYPIQRGGGDSLIGGRDSQLYWNENTGEWWAPVTSGSEVTDWDFSVFRSKDLVTWGLSRGFLDADSPAGLVRGQSVPGGTIPVERQWSNKFARFDGRLYIITSLQVLPSGTNPFGNSGPRLRPYFAEVIDEVNMRFGPVTPMQIGNNDEAKLNPDVILVDGTYWCCIKDSPTRTVEVWSSSSLAGPWTLRQTIDIDPNDLDSLEGNTWGVHRYTDPNDDQNTLVKYRIMLSNNRDADDNLVGRQLFVESLTGPGGPYGDIQELEFSQATRNGVVTNVAMVDDPRAIRTLLAAESVYGGEVRVDIDEAADLRNPTHNLWPQERFEYEIGGAAGSTTVTIQGKLADTFYLAVHNTNPQARITVVGNEFSRPFTVGGGYQELVEVRWSREIERYIPVGRYAVPGVSGSTRLDAGTTTIIPTLDTEYYILGEAGATTVTINERGADSFFVAVHNTAPGATVTFANTSVCRPFTVGGGNQEIIRVIWSEQLGQYMPVGRLASGSGTSGITVQNEGTALTSAATTLNFTGAGVTATGNGATKTINIPGGSADGVVTSASFSDNTRTLTLERSESLPDLTATIPSENEPIVIGVAGQSNAVGSLQATDGDKTIWPGTFAWNGTTTADGTAFAPYVFGTYPLNRGTSPNFANNIGLQAANLLKQATGRDVYVIQLAEGGRRIEPFIQPATRTANGWTNLGGADIAPFFYDQLVDAIAAVPGRTTMRLDQFIWQQGENNQTDTQAEYQAKLQALRSDLIAANVIDASHGSFTIGGLVPDHPYYATHRAAAEAVEAAFSDVVYINSNNLPDVGDDVHFTGDALDGLSIRHICQGNLVSGLFNQPFTKASGQNTFMLSDNGFRVLRRNRAGALTPYSVDQPDNILGNISDPFHGLTLQATDDSGDQFSSGSRDRTLILDQFQNMILANTGQIGNNNRGLDVSGGARTNQLTQTSGTYTWNPDDGSVVNFASSLTGTLTIDISNLLAQKWVSVYVSNPNGQTINFTLPSGIGSVDWAQPGPVTVGNNRLNYFFHRIGGSSIAGISTEYGA